MSFRLVQGVGVVAAFIVSCLAKVRLNLDYDLVCPSRLAFLITIFLILVRPSPPPPSPALLQDKDKTGLGLSPPPSLPPPCPGRKRT